jgi:hypothetical protein
MMKPNLLVQSDRYSNIGGRCIIENPEIMWVIFSIGLGINVDGVLAETKRIFETTLLLLSPR